MNKNPKQLFQVKSPFAMNANYVEIHCFQYPFWICDQRKHFYTAGQNNIQVEKFMFARTWSLNFKANQ